ncbi:putative Synaptic vesicle transporter SVOP [Venustampulla echinocandica]|uniref:Putative Synaptic vesicle transporter SVOP n=1 Tax=Venustampulla echinocandica TaxID=2656787 RepID=A0A370U079_9HELO|nr:putative Synaptic vesicle transporter SVOP [Venustampulla echinocandica]RDL41178.1 putative Synaptic vesicle transporter SVOP [Venustampulla echinocandica]
MADIEQAPQQTETAVEKERDGNEAFLVTFSPDDPENPQNWSKKTKWGVTAALTATGFNRIMLSTIMASAINTIAIDLNMTNLDRLFITNVWVLIWNLICGFANSKGLLLASRLLAGFGASAVYALGYGVLGDVWPPEQRGRSLGIYLLVPLLGAAFGPILGGLQAILAVASIPFVIETYAPLLLHRKAESLRKNTADPRYYAEIETREEGRSAAWKLQNSLSRPLRLLMFHPIVQIQAILGAINYGLLYFALSSFSSLFVSAYGEPVSISGFHYIALCLGEVAGAQICGPSMDYTYRKLTARAGGNSSPELRIPLMVPGAILTPIGLLLYGWAAQYNMFWLVVDLGAAVLSLGMQVFGTTLQAYVMDSYPEHVSSASAATQFLRSLTAFAFPLFAPRMYETLGYGWGNSMLAFLSIGIGLPSTGLLWRCGAKLRAKKQSSY